jgi:hypothetical protein
LIPACAPIALPIPIIMFPLQSTPEPMPNTIMTTIMTPVGTTNNKPGFSQCASLYYFDKLRPPDLLPPFTKWSGLSQCTSLYYFDKLRPPDLLITYNGYTPDPFAAMYYFSTTRPPDQPTYAWCQPDTAVYCEQALRWIQLWFKSRSDRNVRTTKTPYTGHAPAIPEHFGVIRLHNLQCQGNNKQHTHSLPHPWLRRAYNRHQ